MTNVMENLKEKAVSLIEHSAQRFGGNYAKVANKVGVSEATISQVRNNTYQAQGDTMFKKIIAALSDGGDNWKVVQTSNLKKMHVVMNDARKKCLFIGVSEKAGSGKSEAIKAFVNTDESNSCFKLQCRRWGSKLFLNKLLRTLGINPESRYMSNDELLETVIDFFKMRTETKPLLIIDQANSLTDRALINLIHLYNELEGEIGVFISGTENLLKVIKKGVKQNKDGFDELDSRFGRRYVSLSGSSITDVIKICGANGIDENKAQEIFIECGPVKKNIEGRVITVVEDHRRIKRIVQRELLKAQLN